MSEIEIRLSGTIAALRDGTPAPIPGTRVRALLAMLALSTGRTVSVSTLSLGLWGDDPPARIRGSLQTYVARLRRVLGANAVATDSIGYRLDLPVDAVDLLRFERLASVSDDAADAADRLDAALALWVGDPFGVAPSTWIEQNIVPELTERYLHTVERRVDLDTAAGDATTRIPMLHQLIERHPLRETLWARLLTALHGAGRTAEALDQYEVLRTRLAGELGVDPSPDLQRNYYRLLNNAAPLPAPDVDPPTAGVAQQLPPAVAGFTGRVSQLAALDSAVVTDDAPLIAAHGPGGVGKTALIVHWATRHGDRFPDGRLFVDLRGYGPGEPVEPVDALDTLLRGLGVPGATIPADLDGRSAMLRTELNRRRALVVLDNARETAQVRPLLAGGTTTTVVTSRSQLRGLVSRDGARRVPVAPLPADEAVTMLAGRFDRDVTAHDSELRELAELCGYLPVALTVAAERAGRDERTSLADVNGRLRDEYDRLATLTDWADDPLTDVRAVFSWSYRSLADDSARMFRLLGLHPHPQTAADAAAALAGVDQRTAERALDRLTDRHLLTEVSEGWYELHDLPHAYARELAAEHVEESGEALDRLRSWYLHSARSAQSTMNTPMVDYVVPDVVAGVHPARFESASEAFDWLAAHQRAILSVLWAAAADGDHAFVCATAPQCYGLLKQTAAFSTSIELFDLALASARTVGDSMLEALCMRYLGQSHQDLGDQATAVTHLEAAETRFATLQNAPGQLVSATALGLALSYLDRPLDALDAYDRASSHARQLGSVAGTLGIVNNQATIYLTLDRPQEALDEIDLALQDARGVDGLAKTVLGEALITRGEALIATDQNDAAVDALEEALTALGTVSHRTSEIVALRHLGVAQYALGDSDAARRSWERATTTLDEVGRDNVPNASRADLRRLLDSLSDVTTRARAE
ncbi:winged helix-turn-helix domain-containing protein [Nocardioidaceae bacterium SCSIO 66511]|nr:winged helix-turn-helix domain-containing protein [Nocardioidaceae bacterium SCSIO 66511]